MASPSPLSPKRPLAADHRIAGMHDTRFLGVVGVRLSNILFKSRITDFQDDRHARALCVFVDTEEVQLVLEKLGLTVSELQRSNSLGQRPSLDHVVWTQFPRRHLHSLNSLAPERKFSVRLFRTDLHGNRCADGRIYSMGQTCSPVQYENTREKVPAPSKAAINAIYLQPGVRRALNRLISFPGIIHGLQLHHWPTNAAPSLRNEVIAYLDHIYSVWSHITGDDYSTRQAVDLRTVRALQGRAPGMNGTDREDVCQAFTTNKAFGGLTNAPLRAKILGRTRVLPVIIPSLSSFHGNLDYLRIADSIIRSHLFPPDAIEASADANRSLVSILKQYWTPSMPYIELSEGQFQPAHGPASFWLSYNQLLLAALRQFPNLIKSRSRHDSNQNWVATLDSASVRLFQRRAYLLGFRSNYLEPKFLQEVPLALRLDPSVVLGDPGPAESIDYRWGIPTASALGTIRQSAFLPCLARSDAYTAEMTAIFALTDFLQIFLRNCSFRLDLCGTPIYLDAPPVDLQRTIANRSPSDTDVQPSAARYSPDSRLHVLFPVLSKVGEDEARPRQ